MAFVLIKGNYQRVSGWVQAFFTCPPKHNKGKLKAATENDFLLHKKQSGFVSIYNA